MRSEPLPITFLPNNFGHISVTGTTLGALAILEFVDTNTNQQLCKAVLFSTNTEVIFIHEENTAAYAIYYPDGEVVVNICFLVNNSQKTLYATITCNSKNGETRQQIHGLGRL